MEFYEILDKMKRKSAALLIFCVLDRIPIIAYGEDSNEIDEFLMDLSNIIYFRKEFVFYTEFVSKNEYDELIQNEDIDYNSPRIYIRCPCSVPLKELNQFDNFSSWIIGRKLSEGKDEINTIKNLITSKIKVFLSVYFSSGSINLELEGISEKHIDITLEQNILQKISQDTEKAVVKMKRVLLERTKSEEIDKEMIKTLLDFESEKNEVKSSILKKELENFHSGSKRAFFILNRLKLLNDMKISTRIGSKTLLETIDYEDASISRILSFIYKEWKEDFSNLIEEGKKVDIGDKIQSLFG